jgi:hypothetical protein
VSYAKRRLSAARRPQQGMDRLQTEYDALQQKLALLKRDSLRGGVSAAAAPAPPAAAAAAAGPPARLACGGTDEAQPHGAAEAKATSVSEGGAQAQQSDAAAALAAIRFGGRHDGSALCAAAAEAFDADEDFVRMCEQAVGAQLRKTREGATSQSRMLELAGEAARGWRGAVGRGRGAAATAPWSLQAVAPERAAVVGGGQGDGLKSQPGLTFPARLRPRADCLQAW